MAKIAEKISDTVTESYHKIEDSVVGGCKKIENAFADGFNAVSDKCIDVLFAKEGESVKDAKKRLSGEK